MKAKNDMFLIAGIIEYNECQYKNMVLRDQEKALVEA
jgi:hypothetical protein